MTLEDFVYDGQRLSDLGFFIAYGQTSPSNSVSMGSELTFDSFANRRLNRTQNLRAKYDTMVSATFDIYKNDCKTTDSTISDVELSYIMTWLNQKTTKKFIPIYDDISYPNVYFNGTFTEISRIDNGKDAIGLTLTFKSDAPWGYVLDEYQDIDSVENAEFYIANLSDEQGYIYPFNFQIVLKSSGNLIITNFTDDRETKISNCTSGEIITLDCEHQIITSSIEHDKLYNDFNYHFPRFLSGMNVYTTNLPCEIHAEYAPIRKVGILV